MNTKLTNAKLIIIFGPQAVGKMTVGKILANRCGFNFCMNHTTIDLLLPFFKWEEPPFHKLNKLFRSELIREHAKSKKDLIFTFTWDLSHHVDKKEIDTYKDLFEKYNGEVFFIELEADFETRLARNVTPDRLASKPPKRNIEQSTQFMHDGENYKCNSNDDFFYKDTNYIKINNVNLEPDSVVDLICKRFEWKDKE